MAEESYPKRLAAAERELGLLRVQRDAFYPGSREWERANAKVREWERITEDLRTQAS